MSTEVKNIVRVQSKTELDQLIEAQSNGLLVVFFGANWHAPSNQLLLVFEEVAKDHRNAKFATIEAEELSDVAEEFQVESAPTVVFLKKKKLVETITGADAAKLVAAVEQHDLSVAAGGDVKKPASGPSALSATAKSTGSCATAMELVNGDTEDLPGRLRKLINAAPVMLFMKGSPDQPRCGFSRQIVELLKESGIMFGYFDILTDEQVRQGLKEFSNWPTYPQLYVKGELLGGLDLVKEQHADGTLLDAIPKESLKSTLNDRLERLINKHRVMVFIKGTPDQPRCGFSRKMIDLLRTATSDFDYFDILTDNDVREGLKAYSQWPTYPQLYVRGKLVGGLDICQEMNNEGEFASLFEASADDSNNASSTAAGTSSSSSSTSSSSNA